MMKDFNIIEEVVFNQKVMVRDLYGKLYRLLKSSLRETTSDRSTPIKMREFMTRLLKESFSIIGVNTRHDLTFLNLKFFWQEDDNHIDIKNLRAVTQLLGNKLESDELVYLARDATSVNNILNN